MTASTLEAGLKNALPTPLHNSLQQLIREALAPQVQDIDGGHYPKAFLHQLGLLGAYAAALPTDRGGLGLGLEAQMEIIARLAETCGSTAFLGWCQTICAWYLHKSPRHAARERYLRAVARGEILAGTGMSNAVKHLAGIERINLRALRMADGYSIQGALPWVSNLAQGHMVVAAASLEDEGYIMFALPPGHPGVSFRPCPEFAGMDGTGTLGVHLKNVVISEDELLAGTAEFDAYIEAIKPAFLLNQAAMGFGLVRAGIQTMQASNKRLTHVNQFLDDQADSLQAEAASLEQQAARLAARKNSTDQLAILRLRAAAAELCLRTSQSAALHAGAAGYLASSPAQRRMREAMFVAIVTPALKHLRKEISRLEEALAA